MNEDIPIKDSIKGNQQTEEKNLATDDQPKPIHWRLLLVHFISSLIIAAVIAPWALFGTDQYVRGYVFLFAIACVLAILGVKMKLQRYLRATIGLLWLAPIAPIAIVFALILLNFLIAGPSK